MDELARRYREKLRDYCFETPEEAAEQGIDDFMLREAEGGTSLEMPYTMRRAAESAVESRAATAKMEDEESSDGESTSDTPYYNDVVLDIDLFVGESRLSRTHSSRLSVARSTGLLGETGLGRRRC